MQKKFEPPKGTRDFPPGSMTVRENIISRIEKVFNLYGFKRWDGPAFEYLETLTKKSSPEIVKEIYAFKDKKDRDLGLRFELTTSLSRIIAANSRLPRPVKAWSGGKVWRYENTQKGRYREFLQMDADIFGSVNPETETELLLLASSVLSSLNFDNCILLLNDRRILNSLMDLCKVPEEKRLDMLRSLDKLPKIGPENVKHELFQKGFQSEVFEKIFSIIKHIKESSFPLKETENILKDYPEAINGIKALLFIQNNLESIETQFKIYFEPSLVRGFDYYTGPVYEIRVKGMEDIGSISGGGRYDNLVKLFGGEDIPAAGISFGIERIMDIIENSSERKKFFEPQPEGVLIVSLGDNTIKDSFIIAEKLRKEGIPAETDLMKRSFKKQLQTAIEKNFKWVLIIGEEELKTRLFPLKRLSDGSQSIVSILDAINIIKEKK